MYVFLDSAGRFFPSGAPFPRSPSGFLFSSFEHFIYKPVFPFSNIFSENFLDFTKSFLKRGADDGSFACTKRSVRKPDGQSLSLPYGSQLPLHKGAK